MARRADKKMVKKVGSLTLEIQTSVQGWGKSRREFRFTYVNGVHVTALPYFSGNMEEVTEEMLLEALEDMRDRVESRLETAKQDLAKAEQDLAVLNSFKKGQ
jgi:hypothetical protein